MNKVLKLTGEVQALQIKVRLERCVDLIEMADEASIQIAQGKATGKDTSASEKSLVVEQKKLTTNIATDTKNAGQASKGVA